ncbi:MAG: PAS domain S-box protein [Betaproteobacteria bacterium]|nr:PAS domain S-box protein [Betaproteobacteria bacterium]
MAGRNFFLPLMNRAASATEQATPSTRIRFHGATGESDALADAVAHLYSQVPFGLVTTFIIGALATYELWDAQFKELVLIWWCLVLLVMAASTGLYLAYRRAADTVTEAERWLRWLAIGALANGVNWGLAAAVFFRAHTHEEQVFLSLLLVGVTAGGIPVFAASWPIFAIFAASIVAPFTYVLTTFGSRLFTEIAFMLPIFYVGTVAVAYRLNQVLISGYRLRRAYGKLTDDYTTLNQRIEEQIEELLHAQHEIEASGRKLALFAERAPIAVFEMDRNGTILEMNPAAENAFGYTSSELVGRNLMRSLIPADETALDRRWWMEFAARKRPEAGIRARCLRRDGLEIVCEYSLTPLVNEANDLVSVIAQCRDITQQLEAERLKKEFTSTLSHELRTPLTSIIGALQLINSEVLGVLDKEVAELTAVAERNAQRLLDLINDILDIERIDSGRFSLQPEDIVLDELIRESLVLNRAFAERFGVHLALRTEPPRVIVHADRKRLLQVMTNLISNAAKFSPEGGRVELSASCADARVVVSVEDRGPGIPEDFRNRIFSRFAQADSALTRKKGGTGLGLAICKRLIEMMGGEISFADREGGGTSFFFTLPARGQAAAAPA